MRATRTVLGLAILCGAAQAGEEAKKFDLSAPAKWEIGEVVTCTSEESFDLTVTANAPDGEFLPPREMERDLEATWVRQCLEAAPDGSLVRSRVRFDRWTSTGGAATDESLVGTVVETGPDGFELVSATRNPSEQARAWLLTNFGPKSARQRAGAESLRPKGPVAVGETWECDGAALAALCTDATLLPAVPVVPRLMLRLDEVTTTDAGESAKVRVEGRVAIPVGKAKDGPALEILEDSTYEFSGEIESVPGRDHRHGRTRLAADIDVRAKAGKLELFIAGSVERKQTATQGGDAPKAPAPRAADAPPLVRLAIPAAWKAGDGFIEEATEVVADVSTPVDGDGKESAPERTGQAVDWTAEHRCTEVGEDGAPRAMTVTFTRFRRVEGAGEDKSLEGAVVEWRDGKWKFAKEGVKPSKAAKQWLASRFERGADARDLLVSSVTPAMPVSAGETWKGDPGDATVALRARFPFPLDASKTVAEGTLSRGDGTAPCELGYRVSATISCVAGCDCPNAEVMRGGTIEVRGTSTGAPCDWTRGGTWKDETKIAVAVPDEGSNFRRLSTTRTRHVQRSPLVPVNQ